MARESTIGSTFKLEVIPDVPDGFEDLSGATAANPCVLSGTAFTAVRGQYVRIGGTMSKPLDRKAPHRVSTASATSVTVDTDNTVKAGGVAATDGQMTLLQFQEVCFSEFGNDVPAPTEIDVTTMCDTERRNITGLASMGSATFGGPLDLADLGVQALQRAFLDAKPRALIWTTRSGQTGILYGVVSSFSGGPQAVDAAVTYKGTFQVQERVRYLSPMA